MKSSVYIALPLFLLLAVVQTAVLPYFPIFGIVAQVPLLVIISWTLLHGLEEGLVWAFVAGLSVDLFSIGPFGATALAYITAVLVIASLNNFLPSGRFFLPVVYAALGTFIYLLVYLSFVRLLGYGTAFGTISNLVTLVLLNAGLMLPIYWLIYGIEHSIRPRRVEV
ncbi:MAG: rod shape-determining protein MreD [Anaerolineae bacterium]|nr:rod shape-determining protein MreD [Anaerolineae bacterium]